ncbi:MAG: FAD:protein FMN transferase [Aureispira sp.]
MKYLSYLIIVFFCLGLPPTQAQILTSEKEAIDRSKKEQKAILLIFSGSDWCQPCIRFDKQILQDKDFIAFAKTELIVLQCDFPQRGSLSANLLAQNENLAERFNPEGAFPKLLLLDADWTVLAPLSYQNQGTKAFIQTIRQQLPAKTGYHTPLPEIGKQYKKRIPAMGSFFEFILIGKKEEAAKNSALIADCVKEVRRIEALISEWQPDSEISQINQQAGGDPVTVSTEVYQLLERGIGLSQLTQGAFDLTFLAYYDYWDFKNPSFEPFDTTKIKALAPYVDYTQIKLLPNHQVQLPAGFKLGLGGIGQGYAVDQIKKLLLEAQVTNFVVNGSGDVYAHGLDIEEQPWKVGIASPLDRERILRWLPVENFAVVTSGTSERNFEYNGVLYSHIINTQTGFPIQGLQSATVFSPHAEIADALATSLLVLGKELALDLINQLPQTHCILIDAQENVFYSKNLKLNAASPSQN